MSRRWLHHTTMDESRTIHVWPEDDWIDHDLKDLSCVCHPELEVVHEVVVVKHSALDGRPH